MEGTKKTPKPAPPDKGTGAVGEHVHQLLSLAKRLAAAATATATNGSGNREPGFATTPLGLDLGSMTDTSVVEWAQTAEHLNRFLQGILVQAAGELADRVRAARFTDDGFKAPLDLLITTLKLSKAESYRRMRLAEHFLPVTDPLTANIAPPKQRTLGAAFFSGDVSTDQALIVSGFVDDAMNLSHACRIPDEQVQELEETLTNFAPNEPPEFLRRLGTRAINLLDPDGQQPTEGELLAKQGIFFRQARRGLVRFDGCLTVLQYETLMAGIGSATNPRPHKNMDDIVGTDDVPDIVDKDDREPMASAGARTNASARADTNADARARSTADARADTNADARARSTADAQADTNDDARARTTTGARTTAGVSARTGTSSDSRADSGPGAHSVAEQLDLLESLVAQGGSLSGCVEHPIPPQESDGPEHSGPSSPWPHVVEGISVPAPGSEENLPGLDSIDPLSTDFVVLDRRTHGQKLLDGLIDCIKLAARTGKLPLNGGLKPQLFITVTQEELSRDQHNRATGATGATRATKNTGDTFGKRTSVNSTNNPDSTPVRSAGIGAGIVVTPYCGPQPLAAFAEAFCDAQTTVITVDGENTILNVGRKQRIFTTQQRKLLLVRDMGCTFPDCMAPAFWCEAHHIIPWQNGGETNMNNAALLCTKHHHLLHASDWSVRLVSGVPHYTAPYRIDPTGSERHNSFHHGLARN